MGFLNLKDIKPKVHTVPIGDDFVCMVPLTCEELEQVQTDPKHESLKDRNLLSRHLVDEEGRKVVSAEDLLPLGLDLLSFLVEELFRISNIRAEKKS